MKSKTAKSIIMVCITIVMMFPFTWIHAEEHMHQFENHTCSFCNAKESGLYYEGEFKFSWQELIDRGYIVESTFDKKRALRSCSKALIGELVVDEGIVVIMGSFDGSCGFTDSQLTSVILPSSVTNLKTAAFKNSAISHIELNEGLYAIGESCFSNADNLTTITIPSSLMWIEKYVFSDCSSLETVVFLGDSPLKHYENNIFYKCPSLKEINLQRFGSIPGEMFSGCTSLESVILGDNITSIGVEAFANCINLKQVTMTDSVTKIGSKCFAGCSSLKEIKMSGGIKTYPNYGYIFDGCSQLETVYIGKGTTYLDWMTLAPFSGELHIKNLYLPLSLTAMACVFGDCHSHHNTHPEVNVYYEGNEFEWMLIQKENCFDNATLIYNVGY